MRRHFRINHVQLISNTRDNLNILLSCFSFQSQAAAINNHENAGYCHHENNQVALCVLIPLCFFSHVLHYPQNDCNRNLSNLYPSNNYLNLWLSFYLKGLTRAFWRSYTLPPERIVIRFICNVLCVSCYCFRWFFPYFYGSSNCSALSTYF